MQPASDHKATRPRRVIETQLTVYIPKEIQKSKLLKRLKTIAKRRCRSVNFLAVDALIRYVDSYKPHK